MRQLKQYHVISSIVLIALPLLFALSAGAQEDGEVGRTTVDVINTGTELTNACIPADVILLIDQSSSMRNNDASDLRIDAVQSVIDALYLNAAIDCENIVTHRIAAIGFSDEANLLLPPSRIFVEDAGSTRWEEEARDRKRSLLDESQRNFGGETSVARAFVGSPPSALSILQSWEAEELGDSHIRREVIIVVTDGTPCTSQAAKLGKCGDGSWVEHYFTGLNPLYRYQQQTWQENGFDTEFGLIRELNRIDPSVRINILLFNRDPKIAAFGSNGSFWTDIAEGRGGSFIPPDEILNLSTVTAEMNKMIRELLDLNYLALRCDAQFYLEPYVSATSIISAVRPDVFSNVTIIDPNGIEVRPAANVQYNRLDTYETYIITNPIPGAWKITNSDPLLCDRINATLQTASVDVEILDLPDDVPVELDSPYIAPDNERYLEIQITDRRRGEPFKELNGYPLNICANITGPLARPVSDLPECLTMSAMPNHPGRWRSDNPLPAPLQGEYRVTIEATITSVNPDRNGEQIPVFAVDTMKGADGALLPAIYSTAGPIPVRLEANVTGETAFRVQENDFFISLNTLVDGNQIHNPIPISVQVVPVNDPTSAIDLTELFRDEVFDTRYGLIEVSMTGPIGENLMLNVDPLNPKTSFAGLLRDKGEDTTLDSEGNYRLSVSLTGPAWQNYNKENYLFEVGNVTVNLERSRIEGVGFTAAGMPTRVPLNTVGEDGTRYNNPVDVRVQLVNQNRDALTITDVFGTGINGDGLVRASLVNPAGNVVEEIMLMLESGTDRVFRGQFQSDRSATPGSPGMYTVRVYFGRDVTLSSEAQENYRLLALQERPVEVEVERLARYGVILQASDLIVRYANGGSERVPNPDGQALPLNTVDGPETQIPVTYEATARLVNPDGVVYTVEEIEQMVADGFSPDDLVKVALTGPNNLAQPVLATNYDSSANQFNLTFQKISRNDVLLDPEGTYTVRFSIQNEAVKQDALAPYVVVDDSDEYTFTRQEYIGVRLVLKKLGGLVDPRSGTGALQIPLYLDIMEAWGTPLIPFDATPQAVPFEFVILNTKNVEVNWQSIIREGVMLPVGPLLPAGDQREVIPEATSEAETAAEGTMRPPLVSDVVRVTIGEGEETGYPLADMQVIEGDDGTFRIRGSILTTTEADLPYKLQYHIEDLLRDNVVSFSSQPERLTFSRTVTDLYLNPDFWTGLDIFVDAVLILYILWFAWINFRQPMKGTIILKANDPSNPQVETLQLRGPKWLTKRANKKIKIQTQGKTYEGRITVSPGRSKTLTLRETGQTKIVRSYNIQLNGKLEGSPEPLSGTISENGNTRLGAYFTADHE